MDAEPRVLARVKEFVAFLHGNRNLSRHTIRAYENDVLQFLAYVAADRGVKRLDLDSAALDRSAVPSETRAAETSLQLGYVWKAALIADLARNYRPKAARTP